MRVRVHPVPEATRYEAWSFPDFATGADALRAVVQTGTGPTVIRLSDEAETGVNLATTESIGEQKITGGCLRSPCSRAPRPTSRAGTPRPGPCSSPVEARRWARDRHAPGSTAVRRAVSTRLAPERRSAVRNPGDRNHLVQRRLRSRLRSRRP